MYVCQGDPIVYLGGGVGGEENFYFRQPIPHTSVGNPPKSCGFDIVKAWTERCGSDLNKATRCRFVRRLCQNLYWRKCYVKVNLCGCCCCCVR